MSISLLFISFVVFSVADLPPCFSADKLYEECRLPLRCGSGQQVFENTTTYPFWGSNKANYCGQSSFKLYCEDNQTLSLDILDLKLRVKSVNLEDQVITVVDESSLDGNCPKILNFTGENEFTVNHSTEKIDLFDCTENITSLSNMSCNPSQDNRVTYHVFGPSSYNHVHDCTKVGEIPMLVSAKNDLYQSNDSNRALELALEQGFDLKYSIENQIGQSCTISRGICGSEPGSENFICLCEDKPQNSSCYGNQADDFHIRCSSSFSCGNQRNLYYPFWISGREDCGHPDFKLDCSGGFAELSISSVKFRILEANYDSGIIRLARLDYINDLCPQDPTDAPFDENILPFAPNTELLTIYYNCSQDFSHRVSTYVGELACGDDSDDERNYYVTRNLSSPLLRPISNLLGEFKGFCNRNVSIPASGPALNTLQLTSSRDNLKKALEYGFELGLNQECLNCIGSDGTCGYNQSLNSFACYYIEEPHKRTRTKGRLTVAKIGIGVASALVGLILVVVGLVCFINCQRKTSDDKRQQSLKALIPLKHYSYAQVQRITKSFAEVVGKGGFGTVYKGTLSDGRSVAVKILKDSKDDGEDFINEVASMSKTSHVNIVSLLGFCSEGSKRAIVYEFVENGSLDRFISRKTSMNMDWMALYGIALGVARGLEYLHHGCKTKIVHFDIKPQNVLLDDNFCPKVSDFGLAKLCEKKESTLSLLNTRGTIGYIAPELFSKMYGRVSHKSDVYSYGMLLLEMIGARNKERTEASNTSSMYFPEWIYKDLEKADAERLIENGNNSEEEEVAKKMTVVGLWCIQPSASDRPEMNRVIEMMEGNLDALEVPPRPVFQIPAAPLQESSTLSENISVYTEACSINVA